MYQDPQKGFNHKPIEQIKKELVAAKSSGMPIRRIFLADGDAMVLSVRRLTEILHIINEVFPDLNRVSAYCLPRNVLNKTVNELAELQSLGLQMLYVGCETGSDKLLTLIEKGETFDSSRDALLKIHSAQIKTSVMILNGLGGRSLSDDHTRASARLMNETQPNYLSTLVLSFPKGKSRYLSQFPDFEEMGQSALFKELRSFIDLLNLNATIFRSDHASNYLPLKGVLNKDKEKLLSKLDLAIHQPNEIFLRPESMRGL